METKEAFSTLSNGRKALAWMKFTQE